MEQPASLALPATGNRGGQFRVLLAGLLVLGALGYLVWASLPGGTVYYQTVGEVLQHSTGGQPVRVAGPVVPGSIKRDSAAARLQFEIADGNARLPVAYSGVVPDIFGPDIQVVVEGQRDASGVFQAQNLLTKCPSRFASAAPTPGEASQ